MITLSTLSQPEYKIDEVTADPRNMRVRIAARSDGIIAAILSLLGIKGTAHITANPDGCSFERASFSGTSRTFVPWSHASATVHSTNRALGYLGVAFPLVIFGLTLFIGRDKQPTVGLILLGLAALLSVLAFLKQSVLVGVLTTGGTVESLKLKGGATVMEELTAAMQVIESLCRGADLGDHGGVAPSLHPSSTSASPAAAKSGDTSVATCPHCQARMKVPAGREGHAMRCPKCSETFTI